MAEEGNCVIEVTAVPVNNSTNNVASSLISRLKAERGILKRLVDRSIEDLKNSCESLNEFLSASEDVHAQLKNIEIISSKIKDEFLSYPNLSGLSLYEQDALEESVYRANKKKILSSIRTEVEHPSPSSSPSISSATSFGGKIYGLPPPLQCQTFSGLEDRNEFRTFFNQFSNLIGSREDVPPAVKLQYLKGYLKGPAFKAVKHLSVIDSNYETAVRILEKEFLDVRKLRQALLDQVLFTLKPDNSVEGIRAYLIEIRSILHELQELGLEVMEEGSAACEVVSRVIIYALPHFFMRSLKLRIQEDYPSLNLIFEHFNSVLNDFPSSQRQTTSSTLPIRPVPKVSAPQHSAPSKTNKSLQSTPKSKQSTFATSHSASGTKSQPPKEGSQCKLCLAKDHLISKCTVYSSYSTRKQRCEDIGLCGNCSGKQHATKDCTAPQRGLRFPCLHCGHNSHISPLCPNLPDPQSSVSTTQQVNTSLLSFSGVSDTHHLLPTLSLVFQNGKHSSLVRCLIDVGSQISYLHPRVLPELGVSEVSLPSHRCHVRTFSGDAERTMRECALSVEIDPGTFTSLPFLVWEGLQLDFPLKGLQGALFSLKFSGVILADLAFDQSQDDSVSNIQCLLGTDVLQLLEWEKVPCLEGAALRTSFGLCPFGDIKRFLTPSQRETIFGSKELSQQDSLRRSPPLRQGDSPPRDSMSRKVSFPPCQASSSA